MLGGLFSNKSTAAVFVDYEHWYYGYKNIFAMRPNVEEWYKELKEEYNVKSITFFGDFHGSSIERDLERLEKLSKNVVHTAAQKMVWTRTLQILLFWMRYIVKLLRRIHQKYL